MKHIIIIYPYLTSYILPVLQGMADSGKVIIDVVFGPLPSGLGFDDHHPFEHPNVLWVQVEEWKPYGDLFGMYQLGLIPHILKTRPDAVLIWANPRYLSFWCALLAGKLLNIPVYSRGHGLFKKKRVGLIQKLEYKTILSLTHKYICYTPGVMRSLEIFTKHKNKLVVDFNTLYNDFPVKPAEKNGRETGIFYIGRVRDDCGVDILVDCVAQLRQFHRLDIELHIIGDGPLGITWQEKSAQFPWLRYYGGVFDQEEISDISRQCRFGCVPGFMGLNVVHMMSLSLPVVTHGDLAKHMGPEPEYIRHKVNGWLVENPNDPNSFAEAIRYLWQMSTSEMRSYQISAFSTFEKLSSPQYHDRLLNIFDH